MVQILPTFDPGADIGRAIGSGANSALDMLTQKKMVGSSLDKVQQQFRDPNASPIDTWVSLTKALAGTPGGLQLVQEAFPLLRQEQIRQGALRRGEGGQQVGPQGQSAAPANMQTTAVEGAPQAQQQQPLSLERQMQIGIANKIANGMDYAQAVASEQAEQSLKQGEQSRRQQAQQFAMQKRDDLTSKAFPQGVSEPTRKYLARAVDALIERGVPVEEAFSQVFPGARAMQLEDEKLLDVVKRPGFLSSVPENNYNRIRNAAPRLIREDPDYVVGKLQEAGYGPAEAARAVRPGSKEFSKLEAMFSKLPPYKEYKAELGLNAEVTNVKTLQALEKALDRFDPNEDSLAVWRATAFDQGIPESLFLQLVNEKFPKGEGLSEFNRRELPILSEMYQPPLSEIFGDLLGLRFGEAASKVGRNIKSRMGQKR